MQVLTFDYINVIIPNTEFLYLIFEYMKTRLFEVVTSFMLFWIVSDLFSGIQVQDGIVGFLVCGGIFGIAMLVVIPLIRFFTLPVKFITLLLISIMMSVMVFFFLNIAIPSIDFTDGELVGLSTSYFEIPDISLNMMGNVFIGGFLTGVLYTILKWLYRKAKRE